MSDDIIRALRQAKEQLVLDAGLDIRQLIDRVQQEEARSRREGWRVLDEPQAEAVQGSEVMRLG
jgi:hypothetical protein